VSPEARVPATLSPEYRLLTQAASPVLGGGPVALPAGRPVNKPVDWEMAVALGRRHRLLPLLARHLEAAGVEAPEAVVDTLRLERCRTAASSMRMQRGARTIVDALAGAGVPVIALKGLVLLEEVYRDVSLRPMADVDFLVPEGSIQHAEDVVIGLGYRSRRPLQDGHVGPRQTKYAYPEMVSADGLVFVDLHRHVFADAPFDIGELWRHARPSSEGAHLLPGHEDLLVHLAGHFFRDRIRRSSGSLGQLADIAWCVYTTPIDWDVVVGRAHSYGLHGRVFLAFMATNELVAPVVPEEVLAALRPASYSAADGRAFVKRRLLGDSTWHAPGYFGRLPQEAFSARRRPLRRVLPDRAYLEGAYGRRAGVGSSYARLFLLRARRAARRLRPWGIYRDARLNRWMRSVADEHTSAPK